MTLKIAAIQLVSTVDINANLGQCEVLLDSASRSGAKLVVLPENALCYGAPLDSLRARQAELKGRMAALAKQHKIWLVAGSLPWFDPAFAEKPSASCFVFDSQGQEVLHYRKIHLFDADVNDATGSYRESDNYSAGTDPGIFDTPWGKFAVAICYDLRFPEYFRLLSEAGACGVFVPSAFTYVTGEAHWEVLLRARAIENQMYMFAANQGGEHTATRKTWGESMIISPWGRIVEKATLGEALVVAEINLDEVNDIRKKMPVLLHRKF